MADRTNLPAPYESPWRQLAQALRAVAASLGLDLRGLWRRNRQGALPLPRFWPQDLAPLFWPMVLMLALVAVAGLGAWITAAAPGAAPQSPQAASPSVPRPQDQTTQPRSTTAEAGPKPPAPPAEAPSPSAAVTVEPMPEPAPAKATTTAPPAAPTTAPERGSPRSSRSEGLLQSFAQQDLLASAEAMPAQGQLQLQLQPAFLGLESRQQRRLAEAWLETSLGLGFDQLELIDPQGRVMGYRARVGSGMILLDPDSSS